MYTICETFVGAGGSHLGFQNEGFESKYVNDFSHVAIETLLKNNPKIKKTAIVDETDIVDVNPKDILNETKLAPGELDVLFGGIVCKGFSLAGNRSPNDERNYYYRKQLEFVSVLKPKVSIIENVPGIRNAKVLSSNASEELKNKINNLWQSLDNYKGKKAQLRKENKITKEFEEKGKVIKKKKNKMLRYLKKNNYLISVMDDILRLYDELGYTVNYKILNAACYGAATKRERMIIVAVRNDIDIKYEYPKAEYGDEKFIKKYKDFYDLKKTYKPLRTVNDALSTIDYSNKKDIDNKPMNHAPKTVERFKYIPEGDNIANHMDELPEDLKISKFYSRGCTMRLDGNKPSPTLVPGHSNFPLHPKEHRSITVREAAAITGFPNDYIFVGNHTQRCEEVGNAVPPALSQAIAKSVKQLLNKYYNKN
ncbi:DNA cytosine methyltransferase [Methanobrevibacter wolinii]|uniref:DNA cytosine methyltransferase n=1 Tax=Methanobrevibacter wolinii TaxID=190977 RepID=UPI0005B2AE8F|nr:DNA cytosine methyltransferase [Methanobrevibacter wolinii]